MIPCHIELVVGALEEDVETTSYRRFDIALAFLKEFSKHFPNASVFFYGH